MDKNEDKLKERTHKVYPKSNSYYFGAQQTRCCAVRVFFVVQYVCFLLCSTCVTVCVRGGLCVYPTPSLISLASEKNAGKGAKFKCLSATCDRDRPKGEEEEEETDGDTAAQHALG